MPIYKTDIKKNGVYQYRVIVNYVDANGKARQKGKRIFGFSEAKEAEAQLTALVKAADNLGGNLTVKTLYDEYMTAKKYAVRESSFAKTKQYLSLHVLPYFAKQKLSALSVQSLQRWKNAMDEKGLAVSTKNTAYAEFRALLNYAVKMDYLSKNPLSKLGAFKDVHLTTLSHRISYYTSEQFLTFIAVARADATSYIDWAYYVFFNIAFYTGMRKGEINALRWSDIKGNIAHVRRSVAQKLNGDDRETPPKNKASVRDLQLPAPLMRVLDEHKERQQKISDRWNQDLRVCGGTRCLRDSGIDKANRKYAELAGLPRIRIHDFRHSHASLLANGGINIQEIARRLGHSKIETTWNIYSHLYPKEEERAIKLLEQIEEKCK